MPVVSGSSGRAIAEALAPLMGMEYVELITRRFPDGEGYVRVPSKSIESVRSEPVVLVSNTYPDSGVLETILLLEAIASVRAGDLSNYKNEEPQSLPDVGPGVIAVKQEPIDHFSANCPWAASSGLPASSSGPSLNHEQPLV